MRYDPNAIEAKWQKQWLKEKIYEPDFRRVRKSFYNLMMFPYPSAEGLHVGNMYAFTGSDIYGRFKRMRGYDVFEPIGLDGFGIHSENYALSIGQHPADQAKVSEKRFYRQLEMIGNGFAWDEHLETYDPGYYRWTQWIFIQMFKRGLAYRKKAAVNWCLSCKTVLADEQVINGACERCNSQVIKKELEQWFFKITDYAERLLKNLEKIDWPEPIKIAQRNWIGRSEGAEIDFEVKAKNKPNFVLLHGYKGSPQGSFFPWLKTELKKRGYRVQAPKLPNTDSPNVTEQIEHVLKTVRFDENTIVLGHSLGSVVALKTIENLKCPVAKLVLAAGFMRPPSRRGKKRGYEITFDWKFDAARIKRNAGRITILCDRTDTLVPPEDAGFLRKKLDGEVFCFKAEKNHICGKIEPEILRRVLDNLKIFTTRPDTLFGTTYMVFGPEHEIISKIKYQISNIREVEAYINKAKAKSEAERIAEGREKTGVELKGVKALNPANNEEIPVWVADYVLGHVGTGAIMAVPAHDQRDFEFAKKFKLSIVPVIRPEFIQNGHDKTLERLFVKLLRLANTHRKLLIVSGGWAVDVHVGRRVRSHEDIDVCVDFRETDWWKSQLEKEGFVQKVPDSKKDPRYHLNMVMGPLKVDIIGIGFDKRGVIFDMEWGRPDSWKFSRSKGIQTGKFSGERMSYFSPEVQIWLKVFHREKDALDLAMIGARAWTGEGVLIDSGRFNGMSSEKAKWAITKAVGGRRVTTYRLRDWLISRQRYWGPPVPLIFCENCKKLVENSKFKIQNSKLLKVFNKGEIENPGWIAVPEKDLPVKLPYIKNFRPTGTEKSPLASVEKFYKIRCPKCRSWARRETDVSDTFLDSAWYYLRYPSVGDSRHPWNPVVTRKWFPVDMYIGGAEHAVLHLLYVRFLAMAFHDWGLTHFEEPFKKFRAHGLLIKDGAKMSKSRGNVVNPDDYIRAYGADALRMYLMFLGPFEQGGDFRDTGIKGITRFLERTWKLIFNFQFSIFNKNPKSKIQNPKFRTVGELDRVVHRTIKKVTNDIEGLQYNTAISALMVLLNAFEEEPSAVTKEHILFFLRLLAPFAPHITEELYQQFLGNPKSEIRNPKQIQNPKPKNQKTKFRSIHHEPWPKHDPKLLREDTFELVVQVNGKVRDRIEIEAGASQAEVKEIALAREKVRQWLGRKPVRKFIYVPGRIVNIVVEAS